MHLFAATRLAPGNMALEPGEDIQPCFFTWEEALSLAKKGEIRDAKSLVGLLFYDRFFRT
jgi:hypothetical protein